MANYSFVRRYLQLNRENQTFKVLRDKLLEIEGEG
ncbi:MAG: hypothetical protein PWP31_809 [Clostridia bacterium]|nr:hypothetical protein [Clostridia bacterium]